MRALLVMCLALAACELEPDVGPPIAERCSDDDRDPTQEIDFTQDILPILQRSAAGCSPCHDSSSPNAIGVQDGGLDLSSYTTLRRGGFNSSTNIVVPGKPCASVMYLKVSPGPPFGGRMPMDGPPYLSEQEIRFIHDWIAEGAKEQ